MTNEKKAAIAFIVALSRRNGISAVYDYSRNKYCSYTSSGSRNQIQIFDYDRHNFIGGLLPNVYDYASNSYININVRNNTFSGFDYETSQFFSGTICDTMVSLYSNGQYSNYTIL